MPLESPIWVSFSIFIEQSRMCRKHCEQAQRCPCKQHRPHPPPNTSYSKKVIRLFDIPRYLEANWMGLRWMDGWLKERGPFHFAIEYFESIGEWIERRRIVCIGKWIAFAVRFRKINVVLVINTWKKEWMGWLIDLTIYRFENHFILSR